jgi:protein-S-isoprenylcysteine O-methyltransferase Ste14
MARAIVSAVLTSLLLAFFAISPRISEALPDATWFIVLYVVCGLVLVIAFEWIVRRMGRSLGGANVPE